MTQRRKFKSIQYLQKPPYGSQSFCSALRKKLQLRSRLAFNVRIRRSSIHQLFNRVLLSMDFMDWDSYFVFHPKDLRSKIYVEVYDGIVSIVNLETRCSSSAASQIQWWVPTVLFFWLFSPAWDAVQLTLQVGFICPFVVIDPSNSGSTIVDAQASSSCPYA